MSKLFVVMFVLFLVIGCSKNTNPTAEIGDRLSDMGDQTAAFTKSGFDSMYESANKVGRDFGKSLHPTMTTLPQGPMQKLVISCAGHPLSETRIITSIGIKHFTADTSEECIL